MPYRDLDHFDRALDEYAVPDPFDPEPEPSWGLEHVAVDAYRSAVDAADALAPLKQPPPSGAARGAADHLPDTGDLTPFAASPVSEASSRRPDGSDGRPGAPATS